MNLDKLFHLKENHTDVKTEVYGRYYHIHDNGIHSGCNPTFWKHPAWTEESVFTATALSSFIATCLMAALSNYPFVLAPGMGLNSLLCLHCCSWHGLQLAAGTGSLYL